MSDSLPSMATAPLTPLTCESAPPTMPLPLVWGHRENCCFKVGRVSKGLKVGAFSWKPKISRYFKDWNMLKIQLTTHFAETLSSREDDLQSILEAKSSSRWSGSDNYRMGIYMGPLELYNFGGGGVQVWGIGILLGYWSDWVLRFKMASLDLSASGARQRTISSKISDIDYRRGHFDAEVKALILYLFDSIFQKYTLI